MVFQNIYIFVGVNLFLMFKMIFAKCEQQVIFASKKSALRILVTRGIC